MYNYSTRIMILSLFIQITNQMRDISLTFWMMSNLGFEGQKTTKWKITTETLKRYDG